MGKSKKTRFAFQQSHGKQRFTFGPKGSATTSAINIPTTVPLGSFTNLKKAIDFTHEGDLKLESVKLVFGRLNRERGNPNLNQVAKVSCAFADAHLALRFILKYKNTVPGIITMTEPEEAILLGPLVRCANAVLAWKSFCASSSFTKEERDKLKPKGMDHLLDRLTENALEISSCIEWFSNREDSEQLIDILKQLFQQEGVPCWNGNDWREIDAAKLKEEMENFVVDKKPVLSSRKP